MAEEENTNNEEAAEEGQEEPKSSGKMKWIIIGVAALLLLAGAGGAAFFLLGSSPKEGTTEETAEKGDGENTENGEEKKEGDGEEKKEGDGEEKKPDQQTQAPTEEAEEGETFGKTFGLKAFHINLGNPLENRYIRIEIALEYKGGEDQKVELEARLPQLRDAVITITSRKTMEFLLGPDGKHQLRHELLVRFNEILDKKIQAVYITDMLIE